MNDDVKGTWFQNNDVMGPLANGGARREGQWYLGRVQITEADFRLQGLFALIKTTSVFSLLC